MCMYIYIYIYMTIKELPCVWSTTPVNAEEEHNATIITLVRYGYRTVAHVCSLMGRRVHLTSTSGCEWRRSGHYEPIFAPTKLGNSNPLHQSHAPHNLPLFNTHLLHTLPNLLHHLHPAPLYRLFLDLFAGHSAPLSIGSSKGCSTRLLSTFNPLTFNLIIFVIFSTMNYLRSCSSRSLILG